MANLGINLTVQPIRSMGKVREILALARQECPRNYLLLAVGLNNGLRVKDILQLKMQHLRGAAIGHTVAIKQTKTGKNTVLVFNQVVMVAVEHYLKHYGARPDGYPVFFSKRVAGVLTSQACGDIIAGYCERLGLQGRFGCHSLRKTWGYQQIAEFNTNPILLTQRYGHSSPAITMRYIGQEEQAVLAVCSNGIG